MSWKPQPPRLSPRVAVHRPSDAFTFTPTNLRAVPERGTFDTVAALAPSHNMP
jgi:hypothetical protein